MRVPFREELTNDGVYYRGGVVAGALDTTGALAAWSNHDFTKGARASTVGLSIQYVGACKRSDLICRATTTRRGKELIFVDIVGEDDAGKPVAPAILPYRIVPCPRRLRPSRGVGWSSAPASGAAPTSSTAAAEPHHPRPRGAG